MSYNVSNDILSMPRTVGVGRDISRARTLQHFDGLHCQLNRQTGVKASLCVLLFLYEKRCPNPT